MNLSNSKVWYFSRFLPTLERGGGSRRMLQICESLGDSTLKLFSYQRGDGIDLSGPLPKHPFPELWGSRRRNAAEKLNAAGIQWAGQLSPDRLPDLAIVDDPIYFPALMDELERMNVPIIAVCHNLESMVPSQVDRGNRFALLEKEIAILARCSRVITISREETAFLTNQGVRTLYYPYFPAEEIVRRLLRVRRKRRWKRKSGFLLMGTAFNAETVAGMRKVVKFWESENAGSRFGLLHLAGFRVEKHFPLEDRIPGVEVHGSLEDEDLDRLLVRVRACICHQETGAGALTRIPEMLLAGVPVMANFHAARSHHGKDGVIEYPNLDGLLRLINRRSFGSPHLPDRVASPFTDLRLQGT